VEYIHSQMSLMPSWFWSIIWALAAVAPRQINAVASIRQAGIELLLAPGRAAVFRRQTALGWASMAAKLVRFHRSSLIRKSQVAQKRSSRVATWADRQTEGVGLDVQNHQAIT
jgi:hypothetical protein